MDDRRHPRAPSSSSEPPWSLQETKNLLSILSLLVPTTKPNKALWAMASAQMRERGHNRAPHQCKSRWEGLLSLYKGGDGAGPFWEELKAIVEAKEERGSEMAGKQRAEKKKRESEGEVEEWLRKLTAAEAEWRAEVEERERKAWEREKGWRESVVRLERERGEAERRWWEREERRRAAEEETAERTHTLVVAILTELLRR
ncbi:hypothetical protein AMTRI_Chr08g208490 [Amborella trichopoda]